MNRLGIHPVSSKEHELSPTDIFAVAAHEDKPGQTLYARAAKKVRVSPERMLYSAMIQEYSDKRLIRIRAGNTLFTIAAFKDRIGWVRSYNGDIADGMVNNTLEFIQSARKIGFDVLVSLTRASELVKAMKLAARKANDPNVETKLDSAKGFLAMSTGEKRE